MPGPRTRSRVALSALLVAGCCSCGGGPRSPSAHETTASRAEGPASNGAPDTAPSPPDPPRSEPEKEAPLALVGGTPAPDAPRVDLRLSLAPGTTFVVQTIGNVRYPMVTAQVGFAVEERVRVRSCRGEGDGRTCILVRTAEAVDTEGRAGRFIRKEIEALSGIRIVGTIDLRGRRVAPTTLEGEGAEKLRAAEPDWARLHPFYCLRFPEIPVAKGAKWNHRCTVRDRGRVAERNVLWEVSDLTPDPEGRGHRVELRFVGGYEEPDGQQGRSGTIQGIVYFHTGYGLPHVMHERLGVTVAADKGLRTEATWQRTFGLERVEGGKTVRTLTDGRPFPPGINVRGAGETDPGAPRSQGDAPAPTR